MKITIVWPVTGQRIEHANISQREINQMINLCNKARAEAIYETPITIHVSN